MTQKVIALAGPRNDLLRTPTLEKQRVQVLVQALLHYRKGEAPIDAYIRKDVEGSLHELGLDVKLFKLFKAVRLVGDKWFFKEDRYKIVKQALKDIKQLLYRENGVKLSSVPRFPDEDQLGPSYSAPWDQVVSRAVLYRNEVEVWIASANRRRDID